MNHYYKLADPDGWDFYTHKTINYRENIGKTVHVPNFKGEPELCSNTVIHASKKPNDCFVGADIPCSAYIVKGRPVIEDEHKAGFKKLFVLKEIPQQQLDELLGWKYREACKPIHAFEIEPPEAIEREHKVLLKKWASVGASVRAYIGSLFPNIKTWKYIKHKRGTYPFQSAVDLWKQGLVASFDGETWRLHGGKKAEIMFEISKEKLKEA